MEISVIVPTYNNRAVLRKTIEALLAQDFPPERYEIIIADDGSTDGTVEMVQGLAGAGGSCVPVRHVSQGHIGRSAARNLGIRAARGRIVLFVDSDIWADRGLLSAHYQHYPPGTRRLGVQGRSVTHPDARVTPFMRVKDITPDLSVRRRHNLHPVHIITRNFSTLRADLEAVGGFDEGFTGYGWEDIELAMRLAADGTTFRYDPEALGYHHHVETLDAARRKVRQGGEGAVYFWRKYGRSFQLGLFLEILPVMLPVKWLVYRTPLIMPLLRWLTPRAEARRWLLLLNECYTNLIWEAYYDGVFTALARSGEQAPEAERRDMPAATPPDTPVTAPQDGTRVRAGDRSAHGD